MKKIRIEHAVLFIIVALVLLWMAFYTILLPKIITSDFAINKAKEIAAKTLGIELTVEKPVLETSILPRLIIGCKNLSVKEGDENLLVLKDFKTDFTFGLIFNRNITFKELGIDSVFANVDKIMALLPANNEEKKEEAKPPPFKLKIFDSKFYINNCEITASLSDEVKLKLLGKKMLIEEKRNPKYVRFVVDAILTKGSHTTKITINDNNSFYIDKKRLIIKDCPININKSKITLKSIAGKKGFAVKAESKNFNVQDGADLLGLNLILANGSDILAETQNLKGCGDFDILMTKKGLEGDITLRDGFFNLRSLAAMPVNVETGKITMTPENITLKDFNGYYGGKKENKLKLYGEVKDYYKSVDTKITVDTVMTDDFTRNYLSKLIGINVTMIGEKPAGTRVEILSKYNNIDVNYMALLTKGNDILLEGSSLSPASYDRAIVCNMHLLGNILNIENIKYYIASEINKDSKIKPILTLSGNVDLAQNSKILDFGFDIPKPLPSEFLNVFLGQKVFRKGTISGKLEYIDRGKHPVLKGNLKADKVIIPSARLFIKEGNFKTTRNRLLFYSTGKFRRSTYTFGGSILNEISFPIVIEGVKLSIDKIDLGKLLEPPAAKPTAQTEAEKAKAEEEFMNAMENNTEAAAGDEAMPAFVPGIVVLNKAVFTLDSGKFKEINFGNLKATASLDKDGNLSIDSNRFDFADGHSSVKVRCDLVNSLFHFTLGVKDVDSDKIATALLSLKREITGKASGIIDLTADKDFKLDGMMKFSINNGTIQKVGLVEYALNFVSLFRNPMAMISPSTLFDLVNIPEGRFDKISGTLDIKDNVIERMQIKSSAAQLATLIMGRFDLGTRDASLRIYTKFTSKNKGLEGFLRNFSLNRLANRSSLGNSNDANYYSAELELIPPLSSGDEEHAQVFLTTVDGDVEHFNFISALKKIK